MLKRRLKLLGIILLGFIVLVVAFLLFERWRGQIALASFKKQLIAKGEKLSPADFVQTFNESDNGAPAVIAAIEKLQNGTVLPDNAPYRMQVFTSGRAKINFLEPYWITKAGMVDGEWSDASVTNQWTHLAADLATNSDALAEVRAALNMPVLNNNLDYSSGPKMKSLHLAKAKKLNAWFGGAAQLALHERNRSAALENLLALVRLQAMFENDHTLISELVRFAIGAIARTDTWEALQVDGWTDPELAQIQNTWQSQSYATGMVSALERELVSFTIHHHQLRASNDETYQFLAALDLIQVVLKPIWDALNKEEVGDDESGFWDKIPFCEEISEFFQRQIYCRVWRFSWSHQAELNDLKVIHTALEFGHRAISTSSYTPIDQEIADWLDEGERPGIYNHLRYLPIELRGAYEKFISKTIRMEIDRSQVITAIALKRYQLRHSQYPDKLELLVPRFCAAIPTDWMDGKPIKYRRNEDGGFTLYSVGQDGKDNGGDVTRPEKTRSKDLWIRRDYVWPAPATPEEIEEYRKEATDPK